MISKKKSSGVCTCNVNRGGIKKKFQMKALSNAATRMGKTSKKRASKESETSSRKATTL